MEEVTIEALLGRQIILGVPKTMIRNTMVVIREEMTGITITKGGLEGPMIRAESGTERGREIMTEKKNLREKGRETMKKGEKRVGQRIEETTKRRTLEKTMIGRMLITNMHQRESAAREKTLASATKRLSKRKDKGMRSNVARMMIRV